MTSTEQVMQLDEMGVEFAGFIFYPKSPRYVYRSMPRTEIKKYGERVLTKWGSLLMNPLKKYYKPLMIVVLYLVQLHGDETPRYCEKIADYVTVVKTFRLRENDDILWKIKDYQEVADMFLFDTEGTGFGGTGKKFDWKMLEGLQIRKPFFLSGGIEPSDEASLRAFIQDPVAKNLFSIDVNSRFEISPGIKDMNKLKDFITAIKQI